MDEKHSIKIKSHSISYVITYNMKITVKIIIIIIISLHTIIIGFN